VQHGITGKWRESYKGKVTCEGQNLSGRPYKFLFNAGLVRWCTQHVSHTNLYRTRGHNTSTNVQCSYHLYTSTKD